MSANGSRTQKAQRLQAAKDRETDKTVVRALMSSVDGRRWVWLRLSEAMIFVADVELEHAIMAWKAGMRNSGLRLLTSVMAAAPDMYVRMTAENTNRREEEPVDATDADADE